MKRSNLWIAFYLVLIFASGIIVGSLGTRLYNARAVSAGTVKPPAKPSPEEYRHQYVSEMQDRLKLTPDQMTRLNEILDNTGAKAHSERERHSDAMKAIREEHANLVRNILNDEQRPEYEKIRREHQERAKKNQNQAK